MVKKFIIEFVNGNGYTLAAEHVVDAANKVVKETNYRYEDIKEIRTGSFGRKHKAKLNG